MTTEDAAEHPSSIGSKKNMECLLELIQHFDIVARLTGSFETFYNQALDKLVEEESAVKAQDFARFKSLNEEWSQWADTFYNYLCSRQPDVIFTPDRDVLQKFLRDISYSRFVVS